ncbi:MAG TPA: hypothetical protein QGH56_03600 [Candidatus Marinimicrobia bacterium]|jgi:hypothetical protein|nr:hypothetical protein [Candidatus Neomarinimicrobiota bacterium]|tara:strand:+ start:512 stop:739 length:228 start_codon:yes stop_codon:yes gene_type:complete
MPSQIRKFRWLWIGVFILLFTVPSVADACPYCAGQDNKFTDILLPVAILLGSPFIVAGVFIIVVIKNNKSEEGDI